MENWFNVEFLLLKILRLQPDVLDRMEFYRAEYLMENLKEWNEKEKKHNEEEESRQKESMPKFDSSSLSRSASDMMKGQSLPGMGDLGNFKMPSMPKF